MRMAIFVRGLNDVGKGMEAVELHLSDDELERYCLERVRDEPELSALEEHLLTCSLCVERAGQRRSTWTR